VFEERRARAEWLEERRLASDQRAGRWVRNKARDRHIDFLRRRWPLLLVPVALALAATPALLLLPHWTRAFAAGALVASGAWAAVLLLLLWTGTAPLLMGEMGEQWTADELRRLRRRGWKIMNQLALRPSWDVDHVAIGPAGALVVETKWRSSGWNEPGDASDIRRAVRQAKDNANDVGLMLRGALAGAPVRAVVVLWSPQPGEAADDLREVDGCVVMRGRALRPWLDALRDEVLSPTQVAHAFQQLVTHVRKRDAADEKKSGPQPRTLSRFLWESSQAPLAAFVGFLVAAQLLRWMDWRLFIPVGIGLGAAGALAARSPGLRRPAVGWFVGAQFVTALLLAAVALDWIRR
jgi:hypothetical protein